MDFDEDEDFYAPEEPQVAPAQPATTTTSAPEPASTTAPVAGAKTDQNEELEEGEEEDEGGEMDEDDDSDVDIIIDRKDSSSAPSAPQSRYSEIRNIPQRSTVNETSVKVAPPKKEEHKPSGADLPPVSTSKIDVNAIPIHKATGKPITQVNIDEDLAENDKPWRKPGTDLSDYFNYGFDEFTWALYAQKQEALRSEYSQEAVAQNNKKMMEEMTNMMMMSGMVPGMPGAPGGGPGAPAGPPIPGMEGMPPEMQAVMQQMMVSGMDPNQMDPGAMAGMFSGMQNAGGGQVGQGGQGQNFGAGFGGNQGQGYGGYDQSMGGGGGPAGGGGRGGRGRGRRW